MANNEKREVILFDCEHGTDYFVYLVVGNKIVINKHLGAEKIALILTKCDTDPQAVAAIGS